MKIDGPKAFVMVAAILVFGALAYRGMVPVTVVATVVSGVVGWLIPAPGQSRLPPPPPEA